MSSVAPFRGLTRGVVWCLIGGALLLMSGFGNGSWGTGLLGLGLLAGAGWVLYSANLRARPLQAWPWPPDFRAAAEGMARPIDPTPKRVLPPDGKEAIVAHVATNPEDLRRLIADKPPAWPWAVFASVLLQRRNAVGDRLRRCVSGYQPRGGGVPLTGLAFSGLAGTTMSEVGDLVGQLEQFMLSPAFTGTLSAGTGEKTADPDAFVGIANRLMDYHAEFLSKAENCLQTPVDQDARALVQDMGAFTLSPLMGYEQFIQTMCARIGEAQDLLPYTSDGQVVALDDVSLKISLPDGLTDRIVAQIKRFTAT